MGKRLSQAEGSSGVSAADWHKLYDDLGDEITRADSTANDMSTSDAYTLELSYRKEGMQRARELMRGVDGTLKIEKADEL